MWVRSQNGELLQNFDGFSVARSEIENLVIYGWKDTWRVAIAFYQIEEQAEEVLDELESVINNGCPFVYKMPEYEAETNTVDETMIPENKDFYGDVLVNAIKKREEVEEATEKFKEGFNKK